MVTKHILIPWEFDKKAWASAIASAIDTIGLDDLAALLDVSKACLDAWSKGRYKAGYEWPKLMNLIKVVNLLDLNPDDFFSLEDN